MQPIMLRPISFALLILLSSHTVLLAQESVCNVFADLKKAAGPHEISITGELFLTGDAAALASADCENQFVADHSIWPTVISLRPSTELPQSKRQEIDNATVRIRAMQDRGKVSRATATFSGRLNVRGEYTLGLTSTGVVGNAFGPKGKFPAELVYDDVTELHIEELPAPSELPVVPICDLFTDLTAWKGQRIAVRARETGTSEGTWLNGDCKDRFVTNGLQWPASIVVGQPAYYSGEEIESVFGRDPKSFEKAQAQARELRRGRNEVATIGTFVGTLRVRDQYFASCADDGQMRGTGYGHLNGAPAELMVEAVRDVEVVPLQEPVNSIDEKCQRPDHVERCSGATTLQKAASIGCADKVREFILKDGIDSKGGLPSQALAAAIENGHESLIPLLLSAGAPVNPVTQFDFQTPLFDAASNGNINILRQLINAGLHVDQKNSDGETYLTTYGFFHAPVIRALLEAGADPNAKDKRGATALMHASSYGYKTVVELLIQHGANVNATDDRGRTPLMYAANGINDGGEEYYVDAIPVLLSSGADPDQRDNSGQTALDIATKLKHTFAVELLKAVRH